LEGILNKKIISLNLWWLLGLPLLAVCLLTAAASFLTLNYEYLPAEIDFLAWVLYDASYIALDASLCLCLGAFCYAVYEKKVFSALLSAAVTLVNAGLVPMNTYAKLFGVDMELLGVNCHLDYDEYKEFYLENYGRVAYDNITPIEREM
jgi:hypothetical protein